MVMVVAAVCAVAMLAVPSAQAHTLSRSDAALDAWL